MQTLDLKANHAAVKKYYDALNQYGQLSISHEQAVKTAFHDLLVTCGRKFDWVLVPEYKFKGPKGTTLSADAGMVTTFKQLRGLWEAKDGDDNLEKEIKKKFEVGYPKKNIIFQEPQKAILFQGGVRQGLNEDITDSKNLVELVKHFFAYREPHHEEWDTAVAEFQEQVPNLAAALKEIIEKERKGNKRFLESFNAFVILCRQAINPNLSEEAVETMLIQHLLTERIFRKVFDNPDFSRRNVIAIEIEKVIDALTSKSFNRDQFLQQLDVFYKAIEDSAKDATDYTEKQAFLNTVYERFFQGFSKKEADTHGIVYTPQPIVDFMVRSVEDILQKEFGKSLSDEGVHILDPFVGTGNFITRVMKEIKSTKLRHKYENELHCNEIMLLPYYIASMNIEHEYLERMGEYRPFPGICLVDTFELAEAAQTSLGFMTLENTARVEQQKLSPITVIIGNPPYNMGQSDENENNKNRPYLSLDQHIKDTYVADSAATLLNKLRDPYVRAIKWATERIEREGIVALVTNNSFIDQVAFDGMRSHLEDDFDAIYILDLGGNVRKNTKLSGSTHNVFGIQVGVSINLFIRGSQSKGIYYARCDEFWKKEQKYEYLEQQPSYRSVEFTKLQANAQSNWLISEEVAGFTALLPLADKEQKALKLRNVAAIFKLYSLGIVTNRDSYAYSFRKSVLEDSALGFVEAYELVRSVSSHVDKDAKTQFINPADKKIKWTRQVKKSLRDSIKSEYRKSYIRDSLYRPFCKQFVYFDNFWNEEQYKIPLMFPAATSENLAICFSAIGQAKPFHCLISSIIPNLHLTGDSQCVSFYTYDKKNNSLRRENITDWALEQFRTRYKDTKITKWDIFHYTYGVLHDPEYRTRYAANLKRELPRIPYAPDFHAYAKAGKRLSEIHVEYEKQKPYKLEEREKKGKFDWRVEKMRLSKDKTMLTYNDSLTLSGIPPEVYEYRLGNRSALEWVVDQYQVSTDKRSGIVNDPNREDDPEYIYRLIGQVITVSLETVQIVKSLPGLGLPALEAKAAVVQ